MIDNSKFLRNYFLNVETQLGDFLEIEPPFTIEFDIFRNNYSSMNAATIRIYNLSAIKRSKLRQNVIDWTANRFIKLDAGYGTNLPTIFQGYITEGFSVREGVNFISQLSAFDARTAFINGKTNLSVEPNTPVRSILVAVVADMPGVKLGKIGDSFNGIIGARGNAYSGNSCDIALELSNGQFYIDNGIAHFLAPSECIDAQLLLIDASTGLLGTPRRENNYVMVDTIFEPRVVVGQFITLVSQEESFSGSYKIISIAHRGMISPTVCGDAITTLGLDNNGGDLKHI